MRSKRLIITMRIRLKSRVKGHFKDVYNSFDQQLFEYLLPPGAKVLKFDGSRKGDLVHLEFGFPKAEWISKIIENGESENLCYFIDVGVKIPFGLKTWRHKHLVHNDGDHAIIEDDMEFSTGSRILDLLYLPGLYLSFLPRVTQYKKYFKKLYQATESHA